MTSFPLPVHNAKLYRLLYIFHGTFPYFLFLPPHAHPQTSGMVWRQDRDPGVFKDSFWSGWVVHCLVANLAMNWIHRPLWNRNRLLFSSSLVALTQFIHININPIPFATTTLTCSPPDLYQDALSLWIHLSCLDFFLVMLFPVLLLQQWFLQKKLIQCFSLARKDESVPQQWEHKQMLPLLSAMPFEGVTDSSGCRWLSVFCSWPFPKLWCWTRP